MLDISGGFSKTLTDEGLRAVTKHCFQLCELYLSLLTEITGITLGPIFQDPERAANFHKLYLSCREVSGSDYFFCCFFFFNRKFRSSFLVKKQAAMELSYPTYCCKERGSEVKKHHGPSQWEWNKS